MHDTTFQVIGRHSLTDTVADRIRGAIETASLLPGTRLVELEIAKQMGVSRAPLREALRQLEREGLLTNIPGRGHSVITMDEADIREVYTLRAALEKLAVEIIIGQGDDTALHSLQELVDRMRRVGSEEGGISLVDLDFKFHEAVCRLSGHQRLVQAFLALKSQTKLMLAMWGAWYQNPKRLSDEHAALLRAIGAGKVAPALQLVEGHIREAGEELIARRNSAGS